MDGYSGEQIRAAERPHLEAGEALMQRAANGLAAVVRRELDSATSPSSGGARNSVVALVGSGDNGGDTLFAAAELASAGTTVTVFRTGGRVHIEALAAASTAGVRVTTITPGTSQAAVSAAIWEPVAEARLLLDGMLGIGAAGPLRSPSREVVAALTAPPSGRSLPTVVAVDVPSGIDADTGAVEGLVLPADITVTFGGVKAGLLQGRGAAFAGRIELVDVGIRAELGAMTPLVRA